MKQIFTNWSNLILIPIAVILLVIAGIINEVSHYVHRLTGLPFFSSTGLAVVSLFILVLAGVSVYRFIRSFLVWFALQMVPENEDDSQAN